MFRISLTMGVLALALTACGPDRDGDGYSASQDCNDSDLGIHPGAFEACDGVDNDCNGQTDEGYPATCESTTDPDPADGECAAHEIRICPDLDFDLALGDDCKCVDEDLQLDGYEEVDKDPSDTDVDCDDHNEDVHPGAIETCNGADDDCDGLKDEEPTSDGKSYFKDVDGDGFGDPDDSVRSCGAVSGFVLKGTDCNDDKMNVHPGATELCDDVDSDCDGETDDADSTDAVTWYDDDDADGFGDNRVKQQACNQPTGHVADNTDCDDTSAAVFPGADEVCNDIDDDCDGKTDDVDPDVEGQIEVRKDLDHDSYGAGTIAEFCERPEGYVLASAADDCDDADDDIHPGAAEVCNGKDDDCDSASDESGAVGEITYYRDGDLDSHGNAAIKVTVCESRKPFGYVLDKTDCNDGRSDVHPGAPEVCADGVDQDCDGADNAAEQPWYLDFDSDLYGDVGNTKLACGKPTGYVADKTDCNDSDPGIHPGAPEQCDSVDHDCSGAPDNGVVDRRWYLDFDSDLHGDATDTLLDCAQPSGYVLDKTDCDDTSASRFPGNPELCTDGIDNDCDLAIDSADSDCGGTGGNTGGTTGSGSKGSLCAADSAQCKLGVTCEQNTNGTWRFCVTGNMLGDLAYDPDDMLGAGGSPLGIGYFRVTVDLNDDGTFATSERSASSYAGVGENCVTAPGVGDWQVSLESLQVAGATEKSGVWLDRAEVAGTCLGGLIGTDDFTVVMP